MDNANKEWLKIPNEIRNQLIRNVWCATCSDVVKITNYVIQSHKLGIILDGKCGTCGQEVSRIIEK
ncbi:hypothetical protein [Anaerobacillus alkaliphilus]|nr:hypothetical protein [Anaerobacillus alkaliphilus]